MQFDYFLSSRDQYDICHSDKQTVLDDARHIA
jgi:hypothetical protein